MTYAMPDRAYRNLFQESAMDYRLPAVLPDLNDLLGYFEVRRLLLPPPPIFLVVAAVTLNSSLRYHAGIERTLPDVHSRRFALAFARPDLNSVQFTALEKAVMAVPRPWRERRVSGGRSVRRLMIEVHFDGCDYCLRMDVGMDTYIPRSAALVWQPWS